jgi:hypothetical protein
MVYLFSNYIFKCNSIHFFPLNKVLFKTKCCSVNAEKANASAHTDIEMFSGFMVMKSLNEHAVLVTS